jgi:hypothetical protein
MVRMPETRPGALDYRNVPSRMASERIRHWAMDGAPL